MARNRLKEFDKYEYYIKSVQQPEDDVDFFLKVFQQLCGRKPRVLREDFCGTFIVCMEWVKRHPNFVAHGLDLDLEPIVYGREKFLPKLSSHQRDRVFVHQMNVLDPEVPMSDMIVALNFSYFLFKSRQELKMYFENCRRSLNPGGVFLLDAFGGSLCYDANEEETKYRSYSYFWDQASFDPITNEATFFIHFKRKGEAKRERVFRYDWRMWSIPEVREVLEEVGFKTTHTYWEGTTRSGAGDGNYRIRQHGEPCEAWVSYIAAVST